MSTEHPASSPEAAPGATNSAEGGTDGAAIYRASLEARIGQLRQQRGQWRAKAEEAEARAGRMAQYMANAANETTAALAKYQERAEKAEAEHRDLVSRLGFGDNITEPMADNDVIVEWFEQRGRDASDWQESQHWRDDCYVAGHPQDDDCRQCDPALRLEDAEAELAKIAHGWPIVNPKEWERAKRLEAELTRLREGLEALANGEIDQVPYHWVHVDDLRALLAGGEGQ